MKNLLAGKKLVEKHIIWYIIPIVVILIACVAFGIYAGVHKDFSQGINLGIDFTGGTMVTVELGQDAIDNLDKHVATIDTVLKEYGTKAAYRQTTGEGATASVVVRYGLMTNEQNAEIQQKIEAAFAANGENIVKTKVIGATASAELVATVLGSVALSTALILLYVVLRFRKWSTGLSAVIALLHDAIIVLAFTIICNIQINSSFIAAIITIIAYSINNTIVIFDRVRYNQKNADPEKALTTNKIVNMSVAQTFSRSINTTITTLFAIVILAIIGVPSIREFALPVIFGLLAGLFSSVLIAPSLYCDFVKISGKMKEKSKAKKKAKKASAK